jgi:hypothetical protein
MAEKEITTLQFCKDKKRSHNYADTSIILKELKGPFGNLQPYNGAEK